MKDLLAKWFPNVIWPEVWTATQETLIMTVISIVFIFVLGILLALLLFLTRDQDNLIIKSINGISAAFVNIFRSIPFIILIVLIMPFTKVLIGSVIGTAGALPALIISAAPFYARLVEIAFVEIDKGVIEASRAMGASTFTIIRKVLLPEALPAIISGLTVTTISLVGYTAMAGVVGAGGLGNMAYFTGFQRSQNDVTFVATVIILILVFIIQFIGDRATNKIDKR